jgi:hypothetical protein
MTARTIWIVTGVLAAAGVLADLALDASRPGLAIAIGFGGCWLIVIGSKWLGFRLLQRPEAYYAATDHPEVRDDV